MLGKEPSPMGILNVTVIQAEQLRSSDFLSDNDVYVQLSVNMPVKEAIQATKKQEEQYDLKKGEDTLNPKKKEWNTSMPLYQRTQICSSKHPIWNESFAFPIYDPSTSSSSSSSSSSNTPSDPSSSLCTLYLEVYDQDYNKDDFLGQTQFSIPLSQQEEGIQTEWLELHPSGRLQVLIHYMPKSFLDQVQFKWNVKANELKSKMTKKLVNSLADYAAYKIKGSF